MHVKAYQKLQPLFAPQFSSSAPEPVPQVLPEGFTVYRSLMSVGQRHSIGSRPRPPPSAAVRESPGGAGRAVAEGGGTRSGSFEKGRGGERGDGSRGAALRQAGGGGWDCRHFGAVLDRVRVSAVTRV